jgi:hypothetical protein
VANSEQLLEKPAVEPSSLALVRSAELNHGHLATVSDFHLASDALSRDWLLSQGATELSAATKAEVVLSAAAQGTVQNGLDEICNHTVRSAGEVIGAVALGVALRGPAWTRLPAMAFAAVGTLAYGQQLVGAGLATTSILGHMNSQNLEESRQGLKAALGPVIFNSALMFAAGKASTHLAAELPAEFPQVKLASTLSLAKDHLNNLLAVNDGFPPGMSPAYAGSGGVTGLPGRFRLEAIMPEARAPGSENILQMSNPGGPSSVSGDGISFKTSRGLNGETVFKVDHVPPGRTVNISHDGGANTTLASDGKVTVGFSSGDGRRLDLGQTIKRVVLTEHQSGLKQFRFNDKIAADLEVDNDGHSIKALLGNGDHLHMLDNIRDGYMAFPHKDGLTTWVEHGGRVVMQLPGNGTVHEVQLPDKLAYIRLLEKADGGKEFRFLNDSGQPLAKVIKLPPTPELQQMKTADEVKNWHDLKNYIASRTHAQQNLHNNIYDEALHGGGPTHRVEPSTGGMLYPQNSGHHGAQGAFRLPTSYERLMTRELAGVPMSIMRGNDLSSVADMALAQQGHSWYVTNYLDRLDTQDWVPHDNY